MTPLGPLLFDGLPVWQVISRNTQIMWNRELISVDPGGGSGGIDYPSGLTNLGLFLFCLSTELLGRRRIKLARHQFILLNCPKQLGAHVPEVGHVWHQPWQNGERSVFLYWHQLPTSCSLVLIQIYLIPYKGKEKIKGTE